MMNPNASLPALDGKVEQIVELCRQFHVKRLEIFGSAATGAFRPESSDLDFVVDFADALEVLLGRHVDLIMPQSIRNPYFRKAVDASRRLIYEARSEKAPV